MQLHYLNDVTYHLIPLIFCRLIFFFECDNPQKMIFRGKRSTVVRNLTMIVDPGYKYFKNFRGGVQ